LLRVFRIFKLTQFLTEMQFLRTALRSSLKKISIFMLLVLALVIILGSIMYLIEDGKNGYASIPDSIYWAIVTITSGYGNVEPVTKAGEVIALMTGFLGVCMAAIMTGIVASAFSTQLSRKKSAYLVQLRKVLEDGMVSDAERSTLKKLQTQYRLSDAEVQKMSDEILAAKASKS
jgi:voltage-gated potassium channel